MPPCASHIAICLFSGSPATSTSVSPCACNIQHRASTPTEAYIRNVNQAGSHKAKNWNHKAKAKNTRPRPPSDYGSFLLVYRNKHQLPQGQVMLILWQMKT